MESRIEELKQKYWEGNSSLEEEVELKAYFAQNKTVGAEARYFDTLAKANKSEVPPFVHPERKPKRVWMAVAASVMIGTIAVALLMRQSEPEDSFLVEDPQEAFEITRNAMMMMSSGLNQGTVATAELNKINKAEEILTTN
jgi:hypothetical protein